MVRVTFLGHSGFLIEYQHTAILIDYYTGELPDINAERIFVLSSHAHSDHYNPKIFELSEKYKNVEFLLSFDIRPVLEGSDLYAEHAEQIHFLDARKHYHYDHLDISTLKSTDEGIAFILNLYDLSIFHAGDLHNWFWEEEGEKYTSAMQWLYEKEINVLKAKHFDLAFLLLDPRLEAHYAKGFDYFMRLTDTSFAFPMHMWEHYELTDQFLLDPCSEPYRDRIVPIHEQGEQFLI